MKVFCNKASSLWLPFGTKQTERCIKRLKSFNTPLPIITTKHGSEITTINMFSLIKKHNYNVCLKREALVYTKRKNAVMQMQLNAVLHCIGPPLCIGTPFDQN